MNCRQRATELGRWSSRRAWSRAGAISDVLLAGRTGRVLARTTQAMIFLTGALTISSSVAVLLWNGFGPGPLDVFIGAMREIVGVPLAIAVWMTFGFMTAVAWSLGRRPGVGTVLLPLITGPVMQAVLGGLQTFDGPSRVAVQVVIHMIAIAGVGIGAGALVVSGLGAGTGELLAAAASDKSGQPQPRTRMIIEASWLVVGVALGGPFGVGTVLVVLLIGPAVARGYLLVDATIGSMLDPMRRRGHLAPAV